MQEKIFLVPEQEDSMSFQQAGMVGVVELTKEEIEIIKVSVDNDMEFNPQKVRILLKKLEKF